MEKGAILFCLTESTGKRLINLIRMRGLRSITYIYSDDVLEVETDEPGILRDFDTYDDYKKELNQT